jgi:hypothetical protein
MSNLEWHKRYDNVDGTGDMLFGFMLLGFGLVSPVQTLLPDAAWRHGLLGAILPIYGVLIPVMGIGYAIRHFIKRRITWPRTGYVAHYSLWPGTPEPASAAGQPAAGVPTRKVLWGVMLIIALTSALVAAGTACLMAFAGRHHGGTLARAAFVAFWTGIYAFVAFRTETNPWRWFFLILMAGGLLVIDLIVPGGFIELSQSAMLFIALVWLASGGVTLVSYLRHTQPPVDVAQ